VLDQNIYFGDGAAYERTMGVWSRLAGTVFLNWLAPSPGLRWIDIGCGNGAFTELLVERCAPFEVDGVDPSEAQLAFARARFVTRVAAFQQGDAMALPHPADRFDAAVMALVIVFAPDPAKGVREMVRTVCPGGTVATYVWDMLGGGFPLEPILAEMRAMGLVPPSPPQMGASRMQALQELWASAGLEAVDTLEINVSRTFKDFEEFWMINLMGPTIGPMIAGMTSRQVKKLKHRVSARLAAETGNPITFVARANAIKGRLPTWPKRTCGEGGQDVRLGPRTDSRAAAKAVACPLPPARKS
jgi:ubiquinone/menaquinone biosynthesis C-methylase UbiE